MGYFRSIPPELEEHAMVNGCSKIRAIIRILLPLSTPGLVASAIFSFTLAWNESLLALVFTVDQSTMTVPIKLSMIVMGDQHIWGQLMAGAILTSTPIAILYFIGQRFVVQGLTVNPTDISFRTRPAADHRPAEGDGRRCRPTSPAWSWPGSSTPSARALTWRTGDRVMAIVNPRRPGGGAQAELVVVPAASVARVPEGTSLEAAATLPMNGLTVRLALDRLALRPGQTLGVTGAAGAVGGYAVELGVSDGLRVIAVARRRRTRRW